MTKYTCTICGYHAGWAKFLWTDGTLRCPICYTLVGRVVSDVEERKARAERDRRMMRGFEEGVYDEAT